MLMLLDDAPDDVLDGLGGPETCEKCGAQFAIQINGDRPVPRRTYTARVVTYSEGRDE